MRVTFCSSLARLEDKHLIHTYSHNWRFSVTSSAHSTVHPMGVSRVLFQAPLSGRLKVAEGAREVLDAVMNGSAIFVCFVVDVTFFKLGLGRNRVEFPFIYILGHQVVKKDV